MEIQKTDFLVVCSRAFLPGEKRYSGNVFRRVLSFATLFLLVAFMAGAEEPSAPGGFEPRPVADTLELQIELHRRGFSCGPIDGVPGAQTAAALRAFQRESALKENGVLDAPTRALLVMSSPPFVEHVFSAASLGDLQPVPPTWLGKSEVDRLAYATALEFACEHFRASPKLLQRLNPAVDWALVLPGTKIFVPFIDRPASDAVAARIFIRLGNRELQAVDATGTILAHFPVSIARMVEKRPLGELKVIVVVPDPNYTFDPEVFPEVPEARELGRRLIIPPGPNNPVGLAWIGLDRSGYGIHGTPEPEKVGRTESHGCFRLANWDAVTLTRLVRVGTPVVVEP